MLSDIVFRAIKSIIKCEQDYPEKYADFSDHIKIVKSVDTDDFAELLEALERTPTRSQGSKWWIEGV